MNVYAKTLAIYKECGGADGHLIDSDGKMCMIGALAEAKEINHEKSNSGSPVWAYEYEVDPYTLPEIEELYVLAGQMFPGLDMDCSCEVAMVNDRLGSEAVEQLLEKAAIEYESTVDTSRADVLE
jgi:hypothetical protein